MNTVFQPTRPVKSFHAEVLDEHAVDVQKWNALVDNSAAGVPFAYYEFNRATNDKAYYIVVRDGSGDYLAGGVCRARGALPVIGNLFASLWLDCSAMVRRDAGREPGLSQLKAIVYEEILNLARKKNMVQVYLTHWSREEDRALLEQLGFTVEENATFEIGLAPDTDTLFQQVKSSNRRLIKQAWKKEVQTDFFRGAEAMPALSSLQALRQKTQQRAVRKNKNASMLLKSDAFLHRLLEHMQGRVIVGQSKNNGKVNASILLLAGPDKAYYYIGGSDYEAVRKARASNLLHWDCITYLKGQRLNCYDLGGVPFNPPSGHPAYGVYRFKKSFGGELKVYYSGYRVVNQYKYFLYQKILSHPGIRRILNKAMHVWDSRNR